MSSKQIKEIRLHPKQQEAFNYLFTPSISTVLFGGGIGGGKSRLLCYAILGFALQFPGTRYLIGRRRLTDLRASTFVTLKDVAKEMGVELNHNSQTNTCTLFNGSEILLRALEVAPGDQEVSDLGSHEYTIAAVDECSGIEERVYQTLIQRCRYKLKGFDADGKSYNLGKGKVLLVTNPTRTPWVFRIYEAHDNGTLTDDKKVVLCLPTDNPFLPSEYLSTLTRENLGEAFYHSRVLGDWYYSDEDSNLFLHQDLIDCTTWSTDGVDTSGKYLTIDPAFGGKDSFTIGLWNGLVLSKVWQWQKRDPIAAHDEIKRIIAEHQIPIRNVSVDGIGSQFLVSALRGCVDHRANHRAMKNEPFGSLKDQLYFKLSELVAQKKIRFKIPPDVADKLQEELIAHKRINSDKDQNQRVSPKDHIKRAISRSPDLSDICAQRAYWTYLSGGYAVRFLGQDRVRA